MTARVVSLCTGYGGLDLAVEHVFGANTVAYAEVEPAACKILELRWPGVPNLGNVKTADWSTVDAEILTAGYPCQPFSPAGRRKGTDDERHLWPAVREAIRGVRPRLVVLENVAGHRSLGFDTVLGDLAADGYDARWTSLRAADVGAPHGRERLFVLATDANDRAGDRQRARPQLGQGSPAPADTENVGHERRGTPRDRGTGPTNSGRPTADTERSGRDGWAPDPKRRALNRAPTSGRGQGARGVVVDQAVVDTESLPRGERDRDDVRTGRRAHGLESAAGRGAPPDADNDEPGWQRAEQQGRAAAARRSQVDWGIYEPAIRRWGQILGRVAPAPTKTGPKGGQRLSPRFVEWMMGLPAGWVTDVPGITRNEQLKALGNGVVPQQAIAALTWLHGAQAAAA